MKAGRVVVIGGGGIGLCTAHEALRRGFEVTVLEREGAGGDNCSKANAGMVVPSHFTPLAAPGMMAKGLRWMLDRRSPFFVRPRLDPDLARWGWLFWRHSTARHVADSRGLLRDLHLESRRLFEEFAAENEIGLVRRGLLMLCATPGGLEEEAAVAVAAREIGLQAEVLGPAEAARLDPGVTMSLAGAVHYPQDCHLDPERFLESLRSRVLALGGRIEHGVEVESLETAAGRVTAAVGDGRRFEGDAFVLAAGSWSPGLLRAVGLRLPLQAGKGYTLTLDAPPELPQLCSIFAEAKVAVTPLGGRLRFGGTMEIGGLDRRVDPLRVQGIIGSVSRYFPEFRATDFAGVEPWAGLRPVSPDGLPYIGKAPKADNLVINTGHAMMGLSLAPVSGRLAADLLAGAVPFRAVDALSPGRFC